MLKGRSLIHSGGESFHQGNSKVAVPHPGQRSAGGYLLRSNQNEYA
jgi:hypothetical protein